jgi:hypothetical protein
MKQEAINWGAQSGSTGSIVLRFSLYTAGILCFAVLLPWVARIGDAAAFKENGAIEWMQFGLLIAVSWIFSRDVDSSHRFYHAYTVLACLAAFAAVREMDGNLDVILPWLSWKVGYAFIAYAGYLFYRYREVVLQQLSECLDSSGFLLLWAGFIIAIPFAQLVGNSAFLQSFMNDDYSRDYRRIIEEVGELMGYSLILIGSIELAIRKSDAT